MNRQPPVQSIKDISDKAKMELVSWLRPFFAVTKPKGIKGTGGILFNFDNEGGSFELTANTPNHDGSALKVQTAATSGDVLIGWVESSAGGGAGDVIFLVGYLGNRAYRFRVSDDSGGHREMAVLSDDGLDLLGGTIPILDPYFLRLTGQFGGNGFSEVSRFIGTTASGSPTALGYDTGDWVVALDGHIWICTSGGAPGTWVDVGGPGAVSSVFGRTGAVVAADGDYYGIVASALAGATGAARFVGEHTGAPTTGSFLTGDWVIDSSAPAVIVCTAGGSPGTWASATGGTGPAGPPGPSAGELDSDSVTSGVSIGSSYVTLFTLGPVTYDGSDAIFEVSGGAIAIPDGAQVEVSLFESTTNLGFMNVQGNSGSSPVNNPFSFSARFTPGAGSHTYTIQAFCTSGTATMQAGSGGSGSFMAATARVFYA